MIPLWAQSGGMGVSAIFSAPLINSAVPDSSGGSSTPTFTRATTKSIVDFEGLYKTILSSEVGFSGARRVRNVLQGGSAKSESSSGWTKGAGTETFTDVSTGLPSGFATGFSILTGAGSGGANGGAVLTVGKTYRSSCWILGAVGGEAVYLTDSNNTGSTIAVTTSWQRYTTTFTATSTIPQIGVSGAAKTITVTGVQWEDVTGQTNQAPSEYVSVGVLSAPFHGANVDGVKYFAYLNGNTVI